VVLVFFVLLSWGSSVAGVVMLGEAGGLLSLLVMLALFIPSTAVMVRRLHDTGRSGWWYWITLTIIGIALSRPLDRQIQAQVGLVHDSRCHSLRSPIIAWSARPRRSFADHP
jgi:uncharacterized membrane protein YhaH (DUF805 family)